MGVAALGDRAARQPELTVVELPQASLDSGLDLPGDSTWAIALRRSLLAWYAETGRDLPWRRSRDPYAIWISEIMLQQTQVTTVMPYYQRWLVAFPTVQALAAADQTAVLKQWEGLGYYARARNLHRAAQQVAQEHDGVFPKTFALALTLPGIGRTTAGGILSAAFNQKTAILDGNVKRVLARLVALDRPPAKALAPLWAISEALIDPDYPRDFNQALMDLGATVCKPKQPECDRCPWRSHCQSYNLGIQSEIPMREAARPVPHKIIGVAVIWNKSGKILIDRRRQEGLLGGLWEFPGGKLEPGESLEDCVRREVKEELDIEIAVDDQLMSLDHAYTHLKVTLEVFNCRYLSGEPKPLECDEMLWVTLDEIEQYPFPKANTKIIAALKAAASN
ncbi:MAG: A/G-specific adenine glycosylase [Synechococcales cyanobacterium CRU_2_2]|nr:A/G-specific adenine glycosylase [Synechococcales cyanobacterium CRU_2_2]